MEPEATSGTERGADSQQVALELADTRNYGAREVHCRIPPSFHIDYMPPCLEIRLGWELS